jgi:hypothetical protein
MWRENGRILLKITASFCKKMIIAFVFKKNGNFFAENWRKSLKIVIITLTQWNKFLKTEIHPELSRRRCCKIKAHISFSSVSM